MKAASIQEIKQELIQLPPAKLMELCLRMAKYKKENKELLSYILFESFDEEAYIQLVKEEIDDYFNELNTSTVYFAKKGLRKIIRIINKHVRHTGTKQSELEWSFYFCRKLKESGLPVKKNTILMNIYQSKIKKIQQLLEGMHEDLQYDYLKELDSLAL